MADVFPKDLPDSWREFHWSVVDTLKVLYSSGLFSDTNVYYGPESNRMVMKAHSLILKMRSPYFEATLRTDNKKTERKSPGKNEALPPKPFLFVPGNSSSSQVSENADNGRKLPPVYKSPSPKKTGEKPPAQNSALESSPKDITEAESCFQKASAPEESELVPSPASPKQSLKDSEEVTASKSPSPEIETNDTRRETGSRSQEDGSYGETDSSKEDLVLEVQIDPKISVHGCLAFLMYLYIDRLDAALSCSTLLDILDLAQSYDVPGLIADCGQRLLDHLNVFNCVEIFQRTFNYSDMDLKAEVEEFLKLNIVEIIESDGLSLLNVQCFEEVLKMDGLLVEEIDLFEALAAWGDHETAYTNSLCVEFVTRKSVIKKLARLIRYPFITPEDLTFTVEPTHLLPLQDLFDMFLYHNGNKSRLPAGISRKPRIPQAEHFVKRCGLIKMSNRQPKTVLNQLPYFESLNFEVDKAVMITGIGILCSNVFLKDKYLGFLTIGHIKNIEFIFESNLNCRDGKDEEFFVTLPDLIFCTPGVPIDLSLMIPVEEASYFRPLKYTGSPQNPARKEKRKHFCCDGKTSQDQNEPTEEGEIPTEHTCVGSANSVRFNFHHNAQYRETDGYFYGLIAGIRFVMDE